MILEPSASACICAKKTCCAKKGPVAAKGSSHHACGGTANAPRPEDPGSLPLSQHQGGTLGLTTSRRKAASDEATPRNVTHRCRSVKKLSSILTIHRVLPDPVLWFRSMRLTGGRQGKRSRPQAQKSPQSTSGGVCELHIQGVGAAAKTCQNQPRCPQHAIHKLCSPPACRSQPVSSQRGGRRMNLVQVPCGLGQQALLWCCTQSMPIPWGGQGESPCELRPCLKNNMVFHAKALLHTRALRLPHEVMLAG